MGHLRSALGCTFAGYYLADCYSNACQLDTGCGEQDKAHWCETVSPLLKQVSASGDSAVQQCQGNGPTCTAVPVRYRERRCGVLYFEFPTGQPVEEGLLELLELVGMQLAPFAATHRDHLEAAASSESQHVYESLCGLSHHIKNILQGVSGGVHVIEDGLESGNLPLVRNGWDIVRRNQERVFGLLMELLSLQTRDEDAIRWVDLNRVIEESLRRLGEEIQNADVRVDWEPGAESVVLVDPNVVRRILDSLIRNAIESSHDQERRQVSISVSFDDNNERYQIRITDNGCGILAEELTEIFSTLSTRKSNRELGLGLILADKLADQCEGELRVESEVGQGSAFTLELPKQGTPRVAFLASSAPDPNAPPIS